MSVVVATGMTAEEFLKLPDDGVDRELIRGELRERGMTVRNRHHSRCLIRLGRLLDEWAVRSADWCVLGGEAGFVIQHDPDTTVGIDLAVVPRELLDRQSERSSLVHGVPTVAIEILSPSDTQALIRGKTQLYLEAGVRAVWLVDPDEQTVRIHRAGKPPELLNVDQRLCDSTDLIGFDVSVREFFDSRP